MYSTKIREEKRLIKNEEIPKEHRKYPSLTQLYKKFYKGVRRLEQLGRTNPVQAFETHIGRPTMSCWDHAKRIGCDNCIVHKEIGCQNVQMGMREAVEWDDVKTARKLGLKMLGYLQSKIKHTVVERMVEDLLKDEEEKKRRKHKQKENRNEKGSTH